MDYKRNLRYFTAENIGKIARLCWILVAVGFVLSFWHPFPMSRWLGGVLAIGAAIGAIVATSYSLSDKEYDSVVSGVEKHFEKRFRDFAEEKVNARNGRGKAPVSIEEERIKYARAYYHDAQTRSRIGHDGRHRSSKLIFSAYYCDRTTLFLGYERVCLVDGEDHEEVYAAYPFDTLESIASGKDENQPAYAEYDTVTLKLKGKASPVIFRMPNDAELDNLLKTVNSRISADETE